MTLGLIEEHLKTNELIQKQVIPNNSRILDMSFQSSDLFEAILKFLTLVDVQAVNFSNMGLGDTQIRMMSTLI